MSDNETEETEEESTEIEGPADYHCVAHAETRRSPVHDVEEHIWFDEDVLDGWLYNELLDAMRGDGYEVLAFDSVDAEEAAEIEHEGVREGGKKAVLVYRGTVE